MTFKLKQAKVVLVNNHADFDMVVNLISKNFSLSLSDALEITKTAHISVRADVTTLPASVARGLVDQTKQHALASQQYVELVLEDVE